MVLNFFSQYEILKIQCVFYTCGSSQFGLATFPVINSCLWLGQEGTDWRGKFRLFIMTQSLEAGPDLVPSLMSHTSPPQVFLPHEVSAVDPTPNPLGCLQRFFQAVHWQTGLPDPLQCPPTGVPVQGSTRISKLPPQAIIFPWPLNAVTSFLPCVNIVVS